MPVDFPNLVNNVNSIYSRNNRLHKETHTQMHYNKNTERDNLESSKRKTAHHIQEALVKLGVNFSLKPGRLKGSGMTYSKC